MGNWYSPQRSQLNENKSARMNRSIRNSSKISGIFTGYWPCPALPHCGDPSCRSGHCWGDCNCMLFAITEHRSQKSIFWAMQYKHAVKAPQISYCGSFPMQFLAATKQLYEWYFLSVCLSVCPSVCLSVCLSVGHTFLTMFPSSYHHEIFRSYHHQVTSMQKVKVRGQRSRSQRSQPNLAVSGL